MLVECLRLPLDFVIARLRASLWLIVFLALAGIFSYVYVHLRTQPGGGMTTVPGGGGMTYEIHQALDNFEGPRKISIDVLPGQRRNIVHLDSQHELPVAILHTWRFDPRRVDVSQLSFFELGDARLGGLTIYESVRTGA